MTRKKILAVVALAVMGCGTDMPAAYRNAACVSYKVEKVDGGTDASETGVGYIYYLQAIEAGETPVGLEDFLHCKCKVYGEVATAMPEGAENTTGWMTGYSHTFPWMDESVSGAVEVLGGEDVFGWTVVAGYMTPANLQFNAAYSRERDDAAGAVTTDVALWIEYAPKWTGRWWDFTVSTDFGDEDGSNYTNVGFGATCYVLDSLGIGLSCAFASGDSESTTLGLAATGYWGAFSVGATYEMMKPEGSGAAETFGVSAGYRF